MTNEKQAADILLSILETGLLRIRALAGAGRAEDCQKEADHLHNLPALVRAFSWDRLIHYYDLERPAFLAATSCNTRQFDAAWDGLRRAINARRAGAT
jgi:hypothetical protein